VTAFNDDHRDALGVAPIYTVLPALPTHDAQKVRQVDASRLSPRAKRDTALRMEIERVWPENRQVYAGRKVWLQPLREGFKRGQAYIWPRPSLLIKSYSSVSSIVPIEKPKPKNPQGHSMNKNRMLEPPTS
jgi:hypothetical protein